MKKIYLVVFTCILLSACTSESDFNDMQVVGAWTLVDQNGYGFAGGPQGQIMTSKIVFNDDMTLRYTTPHGVECAGTWTTQRTTTSENCYTDGDGNQQCDQRTDTELCIYITDPATQRVGKETLSDITFNDADSFTGKITSATHIYSFLFRK
jgi:hypothetical protein